MRVGAKIPRGQPARPSAPREDPQVEGEEGSLTHLSVPLPSGCPSPSSLEGRTQKEKKAARARSNGKNSDEEAPKAAQKKLKLVRT